MAEEGEIKDEALKQQLGKRLLELRKAAGLTLDQVAVALRDDYERPASGKGTVQAWEGGRNAPDVFTLWALSRIYRISMEALLDHAALSDTALQFAMAFDGHAPEDREVLAAGWAGWIERLKGQPWKAPNETETLLQSRESTKEKGRPR